MWDIRRRTNLQITRFGNNFDDLTWIDVGVRGDRFVCSDILGAVIVYSFQDEDFVEESIIYVSMMTESYFQKSNCAPVLWVGRLLLSVVDDLCSLFTPFLQNNSLVIKVYKQFHSNSFPQLFCLNHDASVLAILSEGFIEFFHVDTDSQPFSSLSISFVALSDMNDF
jgi:hypothetical protein